MKKTIAAVLATLLASMCLVMAAKSKGYGGIQAEGWEFSTDGWEYSSEVRTTRADDEDLLSHFTGDVRAYYHYLLGYFQDVTGCNDPEDWGSTIMKRLSDEMAKIYNEYYNDIDDHPYLRGTIDPDTGEITIIGIKQAGFVTPYYHYLDGKYWSEYYVGYYGIFVDMNVKHLVIPDEIDGHPVTKIKDSAFQLFGDDADDDNYVHLSSLVIGNNVREIEGGAFREQPLSTVTFGDHVEIIGNQVFRTLWGNELTIYNWGKRLKSIGESAFEGRKILSMPPFPDTLETIKDYAFSYATLPETVILPPSVQRIGYRAFHSVGIKNLAFLHKETPISFDRFGISDNDNINGYCYAGSTAEAVLQNRFPYTLIDGDSLLWNGEAVDGSELKIKGGMTEAELRSHLSIDGTSSEIQIDGLESGKVVTGTTVTLFHTVAQAPGKVYTVKAPEIISAAVETLPTKTSYIYKEAFDPTGLSLCITYDNGVEEVVTDGITCTGTNLTIGTNTITATYENVSTTFPVAVRYAWWQQLIRVFLFGFLWY